MNFSLVSPAESRTATSAGSSRTGVRWRRTVRPAPTSITTEGDSAALTNPTRRSARMHSDQRIPAEGAIGRGPNAQIDPSAKQTPSRAFFAWISRRESPLPMQLAN